jgi:hypothetical protein
MGDEMADYIVRVELHGAAWDDYETLHAEMARAGFCRTIRSTSQMAYQLPTAEYHATTVMDAMGVLRMARAAADRTRKSNGVLVVQSAGTAWIGLQQTA